MEANELAKFGNETQEVVRLAVKDTESGTVSTYHPSHPSPRGWWRLWWLYIHTTNIVIINEDK